VFLRAFERLETLRGDNFAGWLKAIAVNGCLNVIERLTGFSGGDVKSFLQNARRNFENACRAAGIERTWRKTT
jgi:hypothetical protein